VPSDEVSDGALPIDPDRGPEDTRVRFDVIAAIALGGALGAPARYEVSRLVHVAKDAFPWATFWTNITGSIMLGFVLVLLIERFPPSRYARAFFAVGFLGAYTTMSTFMVETALLVRDGRAVIAASYVASSMLAGFGAAWLGIGAGRALSRSTAGR
jgi:CrcB protein